MFILLGPVGKGQQYHEIGRSMATIMTDEVCVTSAFRACYRYLLSIYSVSGLVLFVGDKVITILGNYLLGSSSGHFSVGLLWEDQTFWGYFFLCHLSLCE